MLPPYLSPEMAREEEGEEEKSHIEKCCASPSPHECGSISHFKPLYGQQGDKVRKMR